MALSWIPFVFPGIARVRCAFQMRTQAEIRPDDPFSGGNMAFTVQDNPERVHVNRRDLLCSLGLAANPAAGTGFAELNQVHGAVTLFDPEPVPGQGAGQPGAVNSGPVLPDGDGLASSRPGLALLIKTADCQPVLLAHRSGSHVAALHVGWRGNRIGFIGTAVAEFCARYGLRPEDLSAVRGPSLGPDAAEFIHFDTEWGEAFRPWFRSATRTMDLWALTRAQLAEAGVPPERIYGLDLCTASLEAFFSYRRAARCGRQVSVIWIAP